jgi:peptide/nickel transport system substrate-binding protein
MIARWGKRFSNTFSTGVASKEGRAVASDGDSVDRLIDEYVERRISRRDFFRRATALGIGMGAAGTLLAACDSGEEAAPPPPPAEPPPAEPPPAEPPPAEPPPAEPPPEEPPAAQPAVGGVLREGYDRDVSRQDPVNQAWWDASGFPVQHETLIARDPDNQFVPMLAESWEVSPDGLTWTFKIRDGLTFHSGAPCDANAVAECLNEFRDPAKGINAGFWAPVTDVTAGEGNTVVVTMANPYADFVFVLDNGYSAIYNKATRDELADQYGVTGTDGTGPFVLEEFVPGSHASVARWDGYAGSGSPFVENTGTAYLDGVRWVVLTEPATRAQELEAGNVDALHAPAFQDVERLKGNGDLTVIEFPEMSLYQLGLNFKETELGFDTVEVRQAISHAIDRQAIVDSVFFGLAVPAYTIVNPAWPYYDPAVEQFSQFDPDRARELLGGKAISFECIVEADATEELIAQAIQAMLADVGVEMNFTSYGADYFEKLLEGPPAYLFKQLWSNLFDASLLFADSRFFAPACCNASFAAIPELDAAFAAWQTAGDEDALRASSSEAQLIAAEQLPFVPILTPLNIWAHHKRVHGWTPLSSTLYPYYNDVWIEA